MVLEYSKILAILSLDSSDKVIWYLLAGVSDISDMVLFADLQEKSAIQLRILLSQALS